MNIKTILSITSLALALNATPLKAEEKLNLLNPGFEDGINSWACGDKEMSKAVPEAAHNGKAGLRVTDKSATDGSSAFSNAIPATPGKKYRLRFWGRVVEGNGLGVYICFFDAQNKLLNDQARKNENIVTLSGAEWKEYSIDAVAPDASATVKVWVHSFTSAQVVADVDDLTFVNP